MNTHDVNLFMTNVRGDAVLFRDLIRKGRLERELTKDLASRTIKK